VSPRRPNPASVAGQGGVSAAGRILSLPHSVSDGGYHDHNQTSVSPQVLNRALPQSSADSQTLHHDSHHAHQLQAQHQLHPRTAPVAQMQNHHQQQLRNDYMPLDPQIMEDVRTHLGTYSHHAHSHHSHSHDPHHVSFASHHHDDDGLDPHDPNTDPNDHDPDSFQAMLGDNSAGDHAHSHHDHADGDLDMLIDQGEDDSEAALHIDSSSDDPVAKTQAEAEAVARAAEEAMRGGGGSKERGLFEVGYAGS